MKYGEVVQNLAGRGGNWKFYKENFRFLRQAQHASFPCGVIHWELQMQAQHSFKQKAVANCVWMLVVKIVLLKKLLVSLSV